MVLESQKLSLHNGMLGRMAKIRETTFTPSDPANERPAKRLKLAHEPGNTIKGQSIHREDSSTNNSIPHRYIQDSDAEDGSAEIQEDLPAQLSSQPTDIEQSLPPVKTDREAIEEYETLRAANGALVAEVQQRLGQQHWTRGRSSIYVDAFNLALHTVLEEESHLFDVAEMAVFEAWRTLPYEAQYLYVRLFLRKTAAWHRIARLGYYDDIRDMEAAASELFVSRQLPQNSQPLDPAPGEFQPPKDTLLQDSFTFADCSDDHINTLEEASSLLFLDELKVLAKEAKVQGKNKSELLRAFRKTSGQQTSLPFPTLGRSDTEDSYQSAASDSRDDSPSHEDSGPNNRNGHFLRKIMSETGKCIRLTAAPLKLFERVHLVFYRSTEWTEKSLTVIILAQIARRNFPEYIVSRSANIFASRYQLLEFEASLRTQQRIDDILEFHGTPTRESLQVILEIFEDVYPRWEVLLAEEQQKEDSIYLSGEGAYLRRLSPAWVYTRIVHKGSFVLGLGKIKDHAREHATTSKLLSQKLFHTSRRGAWYQRKALLEEHYMRDLTPTQGRSPEEQKKHWKHIALQTCEQGLQDNLVHVIYHYDLQKRVMKLEKALKIPKRLQHEFTHTTLAKPTERTFHGTRIEHDLQPKPRQSSTTAVGTGQPLSRNQSIDTQSQANRRGAKTIWLDPFPSPDAPPQSEVSVEAMCLSHYRSLGWKGFHTEGGVIRTLFALLFYDILFTYIPNVFQTPYQTCPLDLHTDAFYPSRISEINARLAEIANGHAEEILTAVWNREVERKTCVVGLDWEFQLADLQGIVRAFNGQRLAVVCNVMAQEYAERGAGIPDLFLWKESASNQDAEVLFAEVKSENDRLSDAQRLWIHVLAGAAIPIELCHAVTSEIRVV